MAMANRMPVVTTPFHFALEVVQDSRGIIIPYEDHNGTLLAKALTALLEDAALREQMVRIPKHPGYLSHLSNSSIWLSTCMSICGGTEEHGKGWMFSETAFCHLLHICMVSLSLRSLPVCVS